MSIVFNIKIFLKKTILRNLMKIAKNQDAIGYSFAKRKAINLEYFGCVENLGDFLPVIVYDWITAYFGLDKDKRVKKTIHLKTIGSIIGVGWCDSVVWGSGIHMNSTAQSVVKYRKRIKYDIRAVRGPVTRAFLRAAGYSCPEIYGDPAVFMPSIYSSQININDLGKYEISLIEHISRKGNYINYCKKKGINIIDIETHDYKKFIDEIKRSKKVISSSLHGIILAEAYGVPCVFLNDGMDDEIYKYFDWYYSTNRYDIRFARTLDEALHLEPMELPDLTEMRQRLIASFPVDLWN